MARRRGNTFNFLQANAKADDFSVKPIKAEFGGSLPSSIYRINSASSWSRWRRGFEIATASYYQNTIDFPFTYKIPYLKEHLPLLVINLLFPEYSKDFLLEIKN